MPRSAKTLPELAVTRDLFFVFDMAHLIVRPGFMEPSGDQLDIFACGLYSTGRLLLERMQNVNCMFELDRVHHTTGAGAMIRDHFEDSRPWPRHGFALGCFPANCATLRAVPNS